MDLKLTRTNFNENGVYGMLENANPADLVKLNLFTLEHAYPDANGNFFSKIPDGTYNCVLGEHQLAHMNQPFATFEITGVYGHSNILFHIGNFNNDSEGCVLLGMAQMHDTSGNPSAITSSKVAFEQFMMAEANVVEFQLTVRTKVV